MNQKEIMQNYQIVMVKVLVENSDAEEAGQQLTDHAENMGNEFNFGFLSRKPTREEAKEALEQMSDQ